jgi:hypothetical protein
MISPRGKRQSANHASIVMMTMLDKHRSQIA